MTAAVSTDLSAHLDEHDWRGAGLERGLPVVGPGVPTPRLVAPYAERAGNCYALAATWVMDTGNRVGRKGLHRVRPLVIHGSIEGHGYPRIGHAWVTWTDPATKARLALDPVYHLYGTEAAWNAYVSATVYRQYDAYTVARHANDSEHLGPWHPRPFGLDDCPHGYAADACPYPERCPGTAYDVVTA